MRLILKKEDRYCKIYNLYTSKGNKSLVGNLSLFDQLKAFIPGATKADFHFTYVNNGNYHFSYKYFDTGDDHYYDRKLYYNHVATYKSKELANLKDGEYIRRDIDRDNPLDMFMMGERLPEWSQRPIGHTFSALGMSINEESLSTMTWQEDVNIDLEKDLIIDVDEYQGRAVSFGCAFYNSGNPGFDFKVSPPAIPHLEKSQKIGDDLLVSVYAFIIPHESK